MTDSAGAVTVAYAQGGFDSRARVVRWEAASGQCGTFKNLDPATAGLDSRAALAVDPAGTVAAVWGSSNGTRWSRYTAETRTWSTPGLMGPGTCGGSGLIAADPAGNGSVGVTWTQASDVAGSRSAAQLVNVMR